MTGSDVETTFRLHCVNVVATSPPNVGDKVAPQTLGTNVETRSRQHCLNIVATLLPYIEDQQCCVPVPMLVPNIVPTLLPNIVPGCLWSRITVIHEKFNFRHICNIHTALFEFRLSVPGANSSTAFECKVFIVKITKSNFLHDYTDHEIRLLSLPNVQVTNAEPTFMQCWVNIVVSLLANIRNQL